MTASRLVPVVDDPDSGGFFLAAAEHRLVVRWCPTCDAPLHLPRQYCYRCGGWDSEWRELGGAGTVYAWTTVEREFHPAYPVPYTVLVVEPDDAPGVHLMGYVDGRPDLAVGRAVHVWWDEVAEGVTIPNWRLVEDRQDPR